jgi:hypothetical protein
MFLLEPMHGLLAESVVLYLQLLRSGQFGTVGCAPVVITTWTRRRLAAGTHFALVTPTKIGLVTNFLFTP